MLSLGIAYVASGCFSPNETTDSISGTEAPSSDGTTTSTTPEPTTNPTGDETSDPMSSTGPSSTTAPTSTTTNTDDSSTGTSTTGLEETSGSSEGSDSSETGTTDPTGEGMPCMHQCRTAAPNGWHGPYARAATPGTADDTNCTDAYPTSVADGFENVSASAAECDCSCGTPSGGECEDPITVRIYDGSNQGACSNLTQEITTDETPYVDEDGAGGIRVRIPSPDVAVAPTCAPSGSETISPPQYDGRVELCTGAFEPGECAANEVCLPDLSASFASAHCIFTDGDVPCPAGSEYSDRTVFSTDATDSRSCSACSCADAPASCSGSVEFNLLYSGGTEQVIVNATNSCSSVMPDEEPFAGVAYGLVYEPNDPSASSCAPSGGEASGGVSGSDPITVCCTP